MKEINVSLGYNVKLVQYFCDIFDIKETAIENIISMYNSSMSGLIRKQNSDDLYNWVKILLNVSNDTKYNHLKDFLSGGSLVIADTRYKSDAELPKALQTYFKKYGVVCPKCGCLLQDNETHNCYNCDFETKSLDDLSLYMSDVPEIQFLDESDITKFKPYKFVYICKDEYKDESSTDKLTIINVVDSEDISIVIATIEIEYIGIDSLSITIDYKPNQALNEFEVYRNILEDGMGYSIYPYDCIEYIKISDDESLEMYKEVLHNVENVLDTKYLYNSYITNLEISEEVCGIGALACIFLNIKSSNFDIQELSNYKYRVLNCSLLNKDGKIYKLLQMIKDDEINGYILVSQEYPLTDGYNLQMIEEKNISKLGVVSCHLRELCDMYTDKYIIRV